MSQRSGTGAVTRKITLQPLIPDTSTPVLVLSSRTHGTLGIVRSLGRLGIAVYLLYCDPPGQALFSKYCTAGFAWNFPNDSASNCLEKLLGVGREIGRKAILICAGDETAMFVADYSDVLKDSFIFPEQPPGLVRRLCSKKQMYLMCKELGVATAETLFPQHANDVRQVLDSLLFPVMLKGVDGARLQRRTGNKMVIVRNQEELLQKYSEMEDPASPNLMLQEYIPGTSDEVWMFNGYFDQKSDCLAGFTALKVRQYPIDRGMTSLGVCLPNAAVENITKDLMKRLGYRGILDIGYRYDARGGTYKVLDINPRVGATFRLFVAEDGLDVVRAMYLHMTGQMVPKAVPRYGRKWCVESFEVKSCYDYFRSGRLGFWQWAKSYRGVEETAYFALDDPKPLLTKTRSKLAAWAGVNFSSSH